MLEWLKVKMEELILRYRWLILTILVGSIFILGGTFLLVSSNNSNKVEIIDQAKQPSEIVVEIAGAVNNPGIYRFSQEARIDDLISKAGGLTDAANKDFVEKRINRAAVLQDSQKIFIPSLNEQTNTESANYSTGESGGIVSGVDTVNNIYKEQVSINTASSEELEALWGIGRITAQNVIEHRPYSDIKELLDKGILKKNVYERNKDILTVY